VLGAFDLYGRAPAGKDFTLTLPVVSPDGISDVETVQLSLSYDDGKSWHDVPVSEDSSGTWTARVRHANRPGGFVSIRTSAQDDTGADLTLTSIRAYGLS
jgi:hypothetical protein